jgi:hypothetical protein
MGVNKWDTERPVPARPPDRPARSSGGTGAQEAVLALQRSVGNTAVARLLESDQPDRHGGEGPVAQREAAPDEDIRDE